MLRLVFDTNGYISAFTSPHSKEETALLLAVRGKVELFTSVSMLTELARKLRDKFLWEEKNIVELLKYISRVATVMKPDIRITLLKDMPDNRILECARVCNSDLIVTGDKHLLSLKDFEGIGVARVADFLHIFRTETT
ncbi:MAG: putative toxin-antitoxin system toxin component, PIN family [Thermodesulfovibrionales bacterium]|nr:putative toxin-antitoxin system toxin component, PIN family [Thermodesulfovibrionales bacterium]